MKNTIIRCCSVLGILLSSTVADAGDWPQFRFGPNRGAVSLEELPAELHLQWSRDFGAPDPAFPGELRLKFDATYQPVIMGSSVFVSSMVTNSVTALSTGNGEVLWRFFANGPVRFAPIASGGMVYFGSDDGYLYCVDAENGKVKWKQFGRPEGRADRNLLGNRRLISMWPVRGGPVLNDGVVYFAAGLWPEEGIFIHAVDAESGQILWTNDECHAIAGANLDHGVKQVMGLSPQGYLAVVDDRLVVPCGTQLPAVFDLKTGKLAAYTMGWGGRVGLPKGSWFVAGAGRYLTHSGDLYDMRRPNDEKFKDSKGRPDFKHRLYPGEFTRLQIEPTNQKTLGDFRRPILSEHTLFYNDGGIVAEDISVMKIEPRKSELRRKKDTYPDKWKAKFPIRWRMATQLRVQIQSGDRLYAAGPNQIAAIDLPDSSGEPTVSWQAKVMGMPLNVVTANGQLYVTTDQGQLYVFGSKERAAPVAHKQSMSDPEAAPKQLAAIREVTKAEGGFCLVLGLENGELAEALTDDFTVIAFEDDLAKVEAIRKRLYARGIYGRKITIVAADPLAYQFPPFLASLVVSETPGRFSSKTSIGALPNLYRALRPYGGMICMAIETPARFVWTQFVAQTKSAEMKDLGDWLVLAREGALQGAADWSHAGGNAGNTGSSDDRFLRGQMALLWYDGSIRWNRQPGKTEVRVAGGRIFVRADRMLAIDVFTGRRLWDRPLIQAAGAGQVGEFVAVEDSIYVAAGRACLVLDAATGEERASYPMPKELKGWLVQVRLWQDYVIGQIGKHVVCLDRHTGEIKWSFTASRPNLSLAVGGGHAYVAELIDSRRGETIKDSGVKTYALAIASGKEVWNAPGGGKVRYSQPHDLLLASTAIYRGKDGEVHRTGAENDSKPESWNYENGGYIAGDNLLLGGSDHFVMHNLTSGDKLADKLKWFRRGCTPLRTSPYLVTTRYKGNAAYIDLETQEFHSIWNLRGACSNNIFPANGVLNVPNLSGGCTCNYTPASMALIPMSVLKSE